MYLGRFKQLRNAFVPDNPFEPGRLKKFLEKSGIDRDVIHNHNRKVAAINAFELA